MSAFPYTLSGSKILLVDGDPHTGEAVAGRMTAYFEKRSIPVFCDWVRSIERSLLHLKYYEYDIAVVSMHPAANEYGLDFLELVRQRNYDFPVILYGGGEEKGEGEKAFGQGVIAYIVASDGFAGGIPETVDNGILMYRASREKNRLNRDIIRNNLELKEVNEILARQSVRLLKMRKEQENQRRMMESLLNAMSDGVVFVNSLKEIEMLNPAARRNFRLADGASFTFEDLIAFTGFDPFVPGSEMDETASMFLRDFKVSTAVVEYEGAQMGRMLVFHDVTRDREVDRLKAEFQSMVSHELRTPLTAIRGAVENFLRGALGEINEQQRTFLKMVLRNVERQTTLVNDMLDLAKLEAKMMSPKPELVDPGFVVRLAFDNLRYAYNEKGVRFEMKLQEGLPQIYADERMLGQIMDNLAGNALKFTPKGGLVRMEAFHEPEEKAVVFSVSDNGIGVPDELKEKIFERYFQADSGAHRQYKGTGLGLAICRKMAELHNGAIRCLDAPGGGALFRLAIPVSTALRKKIFLMLSGEREGGVEEKLLSHEFHLIKPEANDPPIRIITETMPQLILLDYHLQGIDVLELLAELQRSTVIAKIPVILLGASLTEQEKVQALKMGATDVISRPYNSGEFLARIKRVIGAQI